MFLPEDRVAGELVGERSRIMASTARSASVTGVASGFSSTSNPPR